LTCSLRGRRIFKKYSYVSGFLFLILCIRCITRIIQQVFVSAHSDEGGERSSCEVLPHGIAQVRSTTISATDCARADRQLQATQNNLKIVKWKSLRGRSPRANSTDRVTAAYRRS
jgi:hypothetical protein